MRRVRDGLLYAFGVICFLTLLLPIYVAVSYIWASSRAAHALGVPAIATRIVTPLASRGLEVALGAMAGVTIGLLIGLHLARMPQRNGRERWLRTSVCFLAGAPPLVLILVLARWAIGYPTLSAFLFVFPLVVMLAEVLLRRVPREVSDAALALGVPDWRVWVNAVLPCAWPKIARGVAVVFTLILFQLQSFWRETVSDASDFSLQENSLEAMTSMRLLVWMVVAVALYGALRSALPSLRLPR